MSFIDNLYKSRKVLLASFGIIFVWAKYNNDVVLKRFIFGSDGNGGDMLKIHTYLTDQEIAHLRYQKRLSWHANKAPEKDQFKAIRTYIHDEELKDLGINFPEDKSVEYNKRPPHDFYI